MIRGLRSLARRLTGVRRATTYYLPWLTLGGHECVLLINNVELRYRADHRQGGADATVAQHDADGAVVARHHVSLADPGDTVELRLAETAAGYGFVTVSSERIHSDLYVTLSDGASYTATHGRGEFVEHYPAHVRLALALVGGALALVGRTVPAFSRDQYVYVGPDHGSHLLLLNLSDVTNRIRLTLRRPQGARRSRLVAIRPRGAHLVDLGVLVPGAADGVTSVWRLRLQANAWFNLYVVGAGARGLAGPLSLMHVK